MANAKPAAPHTGPNFPEEKPFVKRPSQPKLEMEQPIAKRPSQPKLEMEQPIAKRPSQPKLEMEQPIVKRPSQPKLEMERPIAKRPTQPKLEMERPIAQRPVIEPKPRPEPAAPSRAVQPKLELEEPGTFDVAKKAPEPPPAAETGVVHPSGVTATELFDRGLKHYDDRQYEQAYDAFLQCYRTGQKLDPYRSQSLQDMLQTLRPMIENGDNSEIRQVKNEVQGGTHRVGPGTNNEFQPGSIGLVQKEQAVKYEKLRSETLNAIFQADRLREKKPTEALELIDRTIANISDSDLTEKQLAPLMRQLKLSRGEIEAWQKQRAPILALEEENDRVKNTIKKEREFKVRVEQELADLVEEFNKLFKQRRFAEAEIIAKKARDLDRENPVTVTMFWKARFARRDASNDDLRERKDESFWNQLNDAEMATLVEVDDKNPMKFPDLKDWEKLTERRSRYGTDNRNKTEEERRIEKSLERPISLHFSKTPLSDVAKHIATTAGINVVIDHLGLSDEGVLPDQEITINVDGIKLSSALNLILEPMRLSYMIQDEVLKLTSEIRQQGKLEVRTYPVADLVIPIRNFKPSGRIGLDTGGLGNGGGASFSVPAGGSLKPVVGDPFHEESGIGGTMNDPWAGPGVESYPQRQFGGGL